MLASLIFCDKRSSLRRIVLVDSFFHFWKAISIFEFSVIQRKSIFLLILNRRRFYFKSVFCLQSVRKKKRNSRYAIFGRYRTVEENLKEWEYISQPENFLGLNKDFSFCLMMLFLFTGAEFIVNNKRSRSIKSIFAWTRSCLIVLNCAKWM